MQHKMADSAKIDVAINVFAKPYQTSLAILSLLRQSGQHINKIWFQFEPVASKLDRIPPYCVYEYVQEMKLASCVATQPDKWLARVPMTSEDLKNSEKRARVRYQTAFENSQADLLFFMHNDVFFFKDLLGILKEEIGDAFVIGQLGQCWNCPASHAELAREVMGCGPCNPDAYLEFRPDYQQLVDLYAKAREKGIFARPYDENGFTDEFRSFPWPLPECRVNEWAALVNLAKTRSLAAPYGPAFPPGAFRICGKHNLDTMVPWFRDMHQKGLVAKNYDVRSCLRHWVGTGNNTDLRYSKNEGNALRILKKHFGAYVEWLHKRYDIKNL